MIIIDNTVLKNVINVIVAILLFIAYVHLFGTDSMNKYLKKEIIITEQEDEDAGEFGAEQPPGIFILYIYFIIVLLSIVQISEITIFPLNPEHNYLGWKNLSADWKCKYMSGNKYISCAEEELFYSKNDVLSTANVSFAVKSVFVSYYKGIVQSLEFEKGMIGYYKTRTVDISLNSNLSYEVFITDPKIRILGDSPSTVPRSVITLTPLLDGKATVTEINLKVEMT